MAQAEEFSFIERRHPSYGGPLGSLPDLPSNLLAWEPPPTGVLKTNLDGSWSRHAGIGFTIRDHSSLLMLVGAASLDASSPLLAELVAACWAVCEATSLGLGGDLVIEGDSATVLSWLRVVRALFTQPCLMQERVLLDISPRPFRWFLGNLTRMR